MSSQDSEGESYVADFLADPKVYGDLEHGGWTTQEEEDYEPKGKEEPSSETDEAPLPQPGTCMWSLKSQASLRSNLSHHVFCRTTRQHYAKR